MLVVVSVLILAILLDSFTLQLYSKMANMECGHPGQVKLHDYHADKAS